MSNRLRNQEVTAKPRITVNGGSYSIDWIGAITGEHCGVGHKTFEGAIYAANMMARYNAEKIREINAIRDLHRHARVRIRYITNHYGVNPLDVAA